MSNRFSTWILGLIVTMISLFMLAIIGKFATPYVVLPYIVNRTLHDNIWIIGIVTIGLIVIYMILLRARPQK